MGWMWELDHKEIWVLKNWFFETVVFEWTLESPLDCQMKPIKSNEISAELEGLMLKVELQYLGHLKLLTDSLEKNLM